MTWVIASAYIAAVCLFFSGVRFRMDPLIAERLRRMGSPGNGRRVGRLRRSRPLLRGVGAATVGLAVVPLAGVMPALIASVTLATLSFRWADLVDARRTRAMREAASGRIPELLDLVAVSVGAGLSPRLALDRSPEVIGGHVGEELGGVRRQVSLGESWSGALEDLGRRLALPDIGRLALTLRRSERLGSPVSEQLRALARDVRAERAARQQRRARRAPVMMLFPLVFLILPAFVLSAVVPAVLVAIGDVP
jgi:tight adherence protein C